VQIFRETYPTAETNILQDNIDQIDNDNTLRSMFSGDSFPTNPAPMVGQPCYRTDLKKLFVYTADGWVEIMGKPIYDPRSISADAFHMDNMTEGANTKIMTSAERDKLNNAVTGPASSIDGGIAVFDGTDGKAIKDAGFEPIKGPESSTSGNVAIYDGTTGKVLKDGGITSNVWDVIIEDQKPQGTGGGTFTKGAWQTRDLNTLVFNHNSLASLSNNRFTLPAGTYCIDWDAPAHRVNRHKTRLYNYTNSTVVAYGTNEYATAAVDEHGTASRSCGTTVITITDSTAFIIQHYSEASYSAGFGEASRFGTEVYTRVRIKKIA